MSKLDLHKIHRETFTYGVALAKAAAKLAAIAEDIQAGSNAACMLSNRPAHLQLLQEFGDHQVRVGLALSEFFTVATVPAEITNALNITLETLMLKAAKLRGEILAETLNGTEAYERAASLRDALIRAIFEDGVFNVMDTDEEERTSGGANLTVIDDLAGRL